MCLEVCGSAVEFEHLYARAVLIQQHIQYRTDSVSRFISSDIGHIV